MKRLKYINDGAEARLTKLGFNLHKRLRGPTAPPGRAHGNTVWRCRYGETMADWDARYNAPEYIFGKEPSGFLAEHANLLPAKGRALALAEGEGRNAVFLAKHGLKVDACDLSAPAIKKLKRLASDEHVTVNAFVADLETYEIAQASYHVIICFHYFDRALIPRIIGGLHVGGLAIMEVFTVDNIRRGFRGPTEKKFCAEKNELAQLFTGLEILEYREGIVENRKAVASIIARKNRSDESPG